MRFIKNLLLDYGDSGKTGMQLSFRGCIANLLKFWTYGAKTLRNSGRRQLMWMASLRPRLTATTQLLSGISLTGKDLNTGPSRSTRMRPGARKLTVQEWAEWGEILQGCSKLRVAREVSADCNLDCVLGDIKILTRKLTSVTFAFVPRESNQAAHLVAKYVFKKGRDYTWDNVGPVFLFNTLATDVNLLIRL
ncbi:hypothetical protein ACFX15_008941 [Malus domestica]